MSCFMLYTDKTACDVQAFYDGFSFCSSPEKRNKQINKNKTKQTNKKANLRVIGASFVTPFSLEK